MTRAEVLEKVRKLYALANGNSNENEVKAVTAAADRLIQQWRLSEAEIASAKGEVPKFGLGSILDYRKRLPIWRDRLLVVLGRHYGVVVLEDKRPGSQTEGFRIPYGTESDIAMLMIQYDRVSAQIEAASVREQKGNGRLAADSFRLGMVWALAKMLNEPVEANVSTSTALATLNNRQEQASEELKKTVNIEKFNKPAPHLDRSAYEAGHAAGRHLHLGEDLEGGPKGLLR